jgi:signal transduction histidine kinase
MPLTFRLALAYLLVVLIGMTIFGVGLLALATSYVESRRIADLHTQADLYAGFLEELTDESSAVRQLVESGLGRDLLPPGTQTRLFSSGGVLLSGSVDLGPFPSRPALSLIDSPFPLPASQVDDRVYVARRLQLSEDTTAILEISQSTANDTDLLNDLQQVILQATLVSLGLTALVSVLLSRSIAGPIIRLTARADALAATIAARDESPQTRIGLPPSQPDEVRRLDGSLERLAQGLQDYVARIDELERTRTQFYRSVSHELRTPLTALRANLENLIDTAPADQRDALELLEVETLRLERLVADLLRPSDDGRLAATAMLRIDLDELTGEICSLLEGRAQRAGVTLRRRIGEPAWVMADRDRLKQVLINLLDNALRVSPAGSTVDVVIATHGGRVRLSVADQGPGIPIELREQIWERGMRGTDPQTVGSAGLGLAIVRDIVRAHAGTTQIDPDYTSGTRIVVDLPRAVVPGAGKELR